MKKMIIQNHLKHAVKLWVDERLKTGDLTNDKKDCLTDDQIQAYAAHQLSHEKRNDVVKHISSCMPCFIKTERYYDSYKQQNDVYRKFCVLAGMDDIQYDHRVNDLYSQVLSLTSDLTEDQYNEHPGIITINKQFEKSSFTNIPIISDDTIHLSISITNKHIIFRHNSNIPLEIIYEKEIIPYKISKKSGEFYETQYDFSIFTDGSYYIYPEVIEKKVLSIYILKLNENTSTERTKTDEKQTKVSQIEIDNSQKDQENKILQRILLAVSVFMMIMKRHQRTMICMLMLLLFSYFSYDYANQFLQQPITPKQQIVSLPWETEKSLAADASRRSFPRYMAFAAGLWKKRSQLYPEYSHKIPKCILPEDASSEKDLDLWNNSVTYRIYFKLGIACFSIYAKKETVHDLSLPFIKKQIEIFKDIQKEFSKHANSDDLDFVDKRLLQTISILSNIDGAPLKRQRNELFMKVYSIIHYLSPHYALN